MTHTKGKWKYDPEMNAVYAGNEEIIVVYENMLQFTGDGHIIAAAPDMLEALEVIVKDWEGEPEDMFWASEWQPITDEQRKEGFECLVSNDRGVFAATFDETWCEAGFWMVSDGKDFERPLRGDIPIKFMPLPTPPRNT